MVKKAQIRALTEGPINCACVIHGTVYDWIYVDKLYAMLTRHLTRPVILHVWTEASRTVPAPYVHHPLQEWPGIGGPRKSWWYKMQMFNPQGFDGRLIYFDLDVIIIDNIDWMTALDTRFFWACRDFRHHWRGAWHGINSSIMIWHTSSFGQVWHEFTNDNIHAVTRRFQGDQDFLNNKIADRDRRYLDDTLIKSWRWEIKDGGMDFKKRVYKRPDAGSVIPPNTHVMVFHGQPKPHEIKDPVIQQYWG